MVVLWRLRDGRRGYQLRPASCGRGLISAGSLFVSVSLGRLRFPRCRGPQPAGWAGGCLRAALLCDWSTRSLPPSPPEQGHGGLLTRPSAHLPLLLSLSSAAVLRPSSPGRRSAGEQRGTPSGPAAARGWTPQSPVQSDQWRTTRCRRLGNGGPRSAGTLCPIVPPPPRPVKQASQSARASYAEASSPDFLWQRPQTPPAHRRAERRGGFTANVRGEGASLSLLSQRDRGGCSAGKSSNDDEYFKFGEREIRISE